MEDLVSPDRWLRQPGPAVPLIGFTLLLADVVLPVPGSLVMVANGALLGLWPGGLLNVAGGVAASLLAYGIGWKAGALARQRAPEAVSASGTLLDRWGLLAVLLSRPLPILAETVAIAAGTTRLPALGFAVASLVGTLPAAMVYAGIGAAAGRGVPGVLLPLLYLGLAAALLAGALRRRGGDDGL